MVLEARNQTWKNTRIIWNINRFGNLVHLAYNPKVEGSNPLTSISLLFLDKINYNS